jgi:hypothetical protein
MMDLGCHRIADADSTINIYIGFKLFPYVLLMMMMLMMMTILSFTLLISISFPYVCFQPLFYSTATQALTDFWGADFAI